MQKKSLETILYSAAGVAVMLAILIVLNFIAGTMRARLDLTQEHAFTLSAGTRAILKKLDTPVTIRFYCTQSESATPEAKTSRTVERRRSWRLRNMRRAVMSTLTKVRAEARR